MDKHGGRMREEAEGKEEGKEERANVWDLGQQMAFRH